MTAVLLPNGKQQYFTTAGLPAVGYKVATFDAGTSNPRVTWQDALKVAQNTNPVILDARGEASIFWDGVYKVQLQDASGTPIWTQDNLQSQQNGFAASLVPAVTNTVDLGSVTLSWRQLYLGPNNAPAFDTVTGNIGYFARTAAEIAAGVTPVNFTYLPGHLYRYGTNTTPGTTDMTAAANAWASVGGNLTMPIRDVVLVTGSINLVSNTTLTIVEGATFKTATVDISVILATGKSNVTIRGGTVQQTVAGTGAHQGLVKLDTCTYCRVENVECIGAQWHGILLSDSSNCVVTGNYIHNSLGNGSTVTDTADIGVYRASSFNVVSNNICYGGLSAEHGIMILDPGGSVIPLKNTIYGNRIGPHGSYGIINYLIDHANTFNTIENNEIEGISGVNLGGNSGAGIYNQGAGGTLIANNTIRNCCINSTTNSLTPAGIGLNLDAAFQPVTVIGNVIVDIANFYGIEVVAGPANIVGNTIKFSAGVLANVGIYANAASNVTITGNHISIDTSIVNGIGINVLANGANISNVVVGNNYVNGCSSRQIRVDTSAAFTIANVSITGNMMTGGSAACVPLAVANLILGTITGNVAIATTVNAFNLSTCTQTRITNNVLTTTGAASVTLAGVNTGGYFDKSNYWNGQLQNQGTGLICEQLANAIPGAGSNSAVGDRIEQSVPVVGQPKGWRCTAAGNPGTWVAEGNL